MQETIENNSREPTIDNLMKLASINEVCRDSEYRDRFLKILDGKRFVWNWAAFFVPSIWASYRKIYWLAFLSSIFPIFLLYTGIIWVGSFSSFAAMGVVFSVFIVSTLLGLGGDYLYCQHLSGKIRKGYHLAPNIKNVDKISGWLFVFCPILGLVWALFVYVIDHRKLKKHQMLRDSHHNLRS